MNAHLRFVLPGLLVAGCGARLNADLGGPPADAGSVDLIDANGTHAGLGPSIDDASTHGADATGVGLSSDDAIAPAVDATGAGPVNDAASAVATDGAADANLAPPAPGTGIQLASGLSADAVQPNNELYQNICFTLPADIQVGGIQSRLSDAAHHIELFQGPVFPDASCDPVSATPIYWSSARNAVDGMSMPAGVGLPMVAGTQLVLQVHSINPDSVVHFPQVELNVLFAPSVQYAAGVVSVSRTGPIVVAPGATLSLTGTCTAPAGSKFFHVMTYGERATVEEIDLTRAGTSTAIVSG